MTLEKLAGVVYTTAMPSEKIAGNIRHNKAKDHPLAYCMPEWREGRAVAIVGGGPSLKSQVQNLKHYDVIFACGSVHDYLVENGIRPTYCVVVDPDPLVNSYMQKIYHSDNECKYLVSSQCDKKVFEHLANLPVYMWHSGGGDDIGFEVDDVVIGGGCTVGTRAMILAMCFGYKHTHLFGFDTCLDETDEHHAYKFNDAEIEKIGTIHEIALDGPEGKKFKVAEYMLGQLFDFQHILASVQNRLDVTVHGGGLIAHLFEIAKRKQKELEDGKLHQSDGPRNGPGPSPPSSV